MVPHKVLLEKLTTIGLNDYLTKWVASYLTNRQQKVVVNGVSSDFSSVQSGVPQGSVLGPLLFIIYVNEVADLPLSPGSKIVMYADDVLLYRPIISAADFVCLQEDTASLANWANSAHLKFNPRKCKAMISSRRTCVVAPGPLLLNGEWVEFVDSIKYLGVTIISDLSWTDHIRNITSKARRLHGWAAL